jgi:hypothetical protein
MIEGGTIVAISAMPNLQSRQGDTMSFANDISVFPDDTLRHSVFPNET